MKFTLSWLKKYIAMDLSPAYLADRLTMLGLEVDSVDALHQGLANVKIAKIIAVKPHPNADKLTLCDVLVGKDTKRVVCGAPNVREGMLTVIALPGAVLPGGLTIKKAKLRGEASEGMLCSQKELEIGEGQKGIMDLSENLLCGQDIAVALDLEDVLIEVDLTPNRPDCASVIGIAREVAGFLNKKIMLPVQQSDLPDLTGKGVPFSVEVKAPDACPRYAARLLKDVKIGPSPWWLQKILLAVGQRPINNVVDITNFVMLEYGQPMHAFDFSTLAGGKIVVRKAKQGEKITTLDGVDRELDREMLLICDADKAVALAGVMGGENTEVSETTTDILLESAYFEPVSIRRTARKTNLSTESSYRFERGVDPQGIPKALERAAQLMKEIAGATVVEGGVDFCEGLKTSKPITLRTKRTSDLLGLDFTTDQIGQSLASIEIVSEKIDGDTLSVTPPSFRVDLEREIDLIEEVARLVGYNEIPATLPQVPMNFPETGGLLELRKQVSGLMVSLGFHEAINYSFVTEKHFDMLGLTGNDDARKTVKLQNPLGEEQSVMRTMLLPGLLENLRRNINHQNADVRLFEVGKVFLPANDALPVEKQYLAAVMSGRRYPNAPQLHFGNNTVDMLDAKGVMGQLLAELRVAGISFKTDDAVPASFEGGEYVVIHANGALLGSFGTLNRNAAKEFGIKQDVYCLQLDLDTLAKAAVTVKTFAPLPKFPSVQWDIAVLVPENVGGGDIIAAIQDSGEKLIENVEIFDVYRGKNIDKGYKSVAVSVTYRSEKNTLDDETVDKAHKKIIDRILSNFKGKLREV